MTQAPGASLLVAAGAQRCCDCPTSLSSHSSSDQRRLFSPCWNWKEWPKDGQNVSNGVGKGQEYPPGVRVLLSASLFPHDAFMPGSFSQNGQSQAQSAKIPRGCTHCSQETCCIMMAEWYHIPCGQEFWQIGRIGNRRVPVSQHVCDLSSPNRT